LPVDFDQIDNLHRCKANGVAEIVGMSTLASLCMLEYTILWRLLQFMETPAIISGCSLVVYYDLGFMHHVPPLICCDFINQYLRAAATGPSFKKKI
jgi:hypothetical protein